jgi:hypothetical protein
VLSKYEQTVVDPGDMPLSIADNISRSLGIPNWSAFLLKPRDGDIWEIREDEAEISSWMYTCEWKEGMQYWSKNIYDTWTEKGGRSQWWTQKGTRRRSP